jgi:hypothetical protein
VRDLDPFLLVDLRASELGDPRLIPFTIGSPAWSRNALPLRRWGSIVPRSPSRTIALWRSRGGRDRSGGRTPAR